MKIETITHPSGDQLPLLVDEDGLPITLPNEFVIARRHLSLNTLIRNLRDIAAFWRWLIREDIDLLSKIKSAKQFTEAQIIGSAVEALRRDQSAKRKVVKIGVSPLTFNQRLATVRQFLEWCFDVEIASMDNADSRYTHLRQNKKTVSTWLGNCFISSPPINEEVRKGLTVNEITFLLKILNPNNPEVTGRDSAVRFRNYISTIVMLCYGLRPGELLNLRIEDIEIGAISAIHVRRRRQNNADTRKPRPRIKRNGRILSIDDAEFARAIDDYIMVWRDVLARGAKSESDYLILSDEGDALSQSSMTQFYQLLRKKNPDFLPKNLSAKTLRHTFSSQMEKSLRTAGVPEDRRRQALAYLRGDSSLTSQDVYIAQDIEDQANLALRKYHKNMFSGKRNDTAG
ncbi:tyrosine-type recombinase/integrase [Collimonas fungivorans]|uniref:tyrosine-type recombinase/integrase n=1 Tax=Collimonas fungivorans TaxID=158899 RepID=UPI003FA38F9C